MKYTKIIYFLIVIYISGSTFASTSGSINQTAITEGLNSGLNGAFGARRAARCSSDDRWACVEAAMGFAQMAGSLMQMFQTLGSRDELSPGTDWSIPQFDTEFGNVNKDDQPYVQPIIDAAKSGKTADYLKAQEKLNNLAKKDIEKLKNAGYTFDAEKGTVTTPEGTKSISSLAASMGSGSGLSNYSENLSRALNSAPQGGGSGVSLTGGKKSAVGEDDSAARSFASYEKKSGSSVDSFLKNLDKGELEGDKLVGMSKNTKNGEPIGVSMGNIFTTIHVKYKSIQTDFK